MCIFYRNVYIVLHVQYMQVHVQCNIVCTLYYTNLNIIYCIIYMYVQISHK